MNKSKQNKKNKIKHNPRAYGSSLNADNRIFNGTVHGFGTISSDAAGKMALAVQMDPNSLSSTDFADFSVAYDEFRVLGCRITLTSLLQNSITSSSNIMVVAYDNDTHATPTAYTQIVQYSTAKYTSAIFQHNAGRVFQHTWWRPTAGGETTVPWSDVATPSGSDGAILLYSETLTVSTSYLAYVVELFCEFRGRR